MASANNMDSGKGGEAPPPQSWGAGEAGKPLGVLVRFPQNWGLEGFFSEFPKLGAEGPLFRLPRIGVRGPFPHKSKVGLALRKAGALSNQWSQ
jgi:hypothetical protein